MAATSDVELEEKTISDLPLEVLRHIFSYLPHNIRVVRLVCIKWNESCNNEEVSGHEKLVIRSGKNEAEFFSDRKFRRNIYDLCFERITFKTDNVSFFKKFGRRLRSLTLKHCSADEDAPFLQYCENLNSLDLDYCSSTIVQSFRGSDGSFVQSRIGSLTLISCPLWSDETMDACFRICPRLRSLTLKWLPLNAFPLAEKRFYSWKDDEERVFNRSDIFSFSCIYHALSMRTATLVELNLEGTDGIAPKQIEQIASIPNLKLRNLTLTHHHGLEHRNICNIVSHQPDLQSITLRRNRAMHLRGSADWIEKCSKLTRLKIEMTEYPAVFDEKLLNALTSRPNLRELVLQTDDYLDVRLRGDAKNKRPAFDQLRTLELSLPFIKYDCVLGKVSVNLQHLDLSHFDSESSRVDAEITSKTLQFVCDRFVNLETLKLTLGDESAGSTYWNDFTPERESFGNLEKLKTLHVTAPSLLCCPTTHLKRFKAPNLKSLKLVGFDVVDENSLRDLVQYYPLLECLKLYTRSELEPSDARIMSCWKRLNSFCYDSKEYLQLHQRRGNEDKFATLFESIETA